MVFGRLSAKSSPIVQPALCTVALRARIPRHEHHREAWRLTQSWADFQMQVRLRGTLRLIVIARQDVRKYMRAVGESPIKTFLSSHPEKGIWTLTP